MLQPSPGGLYLYGPDKFITSARFVQQAAIDRNLVGALEHDWVIFPIILGMSSSQLTKSIIFQRGWLKPPTRTWTFWKEFINTMGPLCPKA